MTLLDALREVGKFYEPGAAAFYDNFEPNPWQEAHDALERAAFLNDAELMSAAAESHVARCRELVELFRSKGMPSAGHSMKDAMYMSSDRLRKSVSRRRKACWRCGTTEGVGLVADPDDKAGVLIACPKHRDVKSEREFADIERAAP